MAGLGLGFGSPPPVAARRLPAELPTLLHALVPGVLCLLIFPGSLFLPPVRGRPSVCRGGGRVGEEPCWPEKWAGSCRGPWSSLGSEAVAPAQLLAPLEVRLGHTVLLVALVRPDAAQPVPGLDVHSLDLVFAASWPLHWQVLPWQSCHLPASLAAKPGPDLG